MERAGESAGFLREYLKQEKEWQTLHWAGKAGQIGGFILLALMVSSLLLLTGLFLGFFLAKYLQGQGLPTWQAYLSVAGIYAVLTILTYLLRVPLLFNPVLRLMLSIFRDDSDAA